MEIKCSKCGIVKDIEEFYKRKANKNGHEARCKECASKNSRKAYVKESAKIKANVARLKKERAAKWNNWKAKQSCSKCGEDATCCLDFHHLDPSTKDYNLGSMTMSYSWERIMEEVSKCIILCSNCHRKLHHDMKQQI